MLAAPFFLGSCAGLAGHRGQSKGPRRKTHARREGPSAKTKHPERELKGFEKVSLAPGETKHVTLSLDARAFSYWDEAKHSWTIDPGKFVILVGDSSESTPLHANLTIN